MLGVGPKLRWLAIMSILVLLTTACGSGGDDDGGNQGPAVSSEAGSEESNATDDAADDTGSADSEDADSGDTSSDDAIAAPASAEVDCEQISAAVRSAGDLVGNDPTLARNGDPEREFNEARATLLVLKGQAPEIADEIDTTIEGLDAIGAIFADIGWNTDFKEDPAAMGTLVRAGFADLAVHAMMTSVADIGVWLASNCAS